jgi:outer membrane protein W
MIRFVIIVFLSFVLFNSAIAQFNPGKIGVALNAVYTTSAEIFLNPNSSSNEIRNKSFTLEDIWNPGLDVRYRLSDEFILGLNIEYIKKTAVAPNLTAFVGSQVFIFEVEDGLEVVPIEITAHYYFPFSTEELKFMMGGGLGYYIGEFVRKFQDVELDIVQRKFSLGLHVSASMDYMIFDNLSARFEMKFRDPQYTVSSKYSKTEVVVPGIPEPVTLLESPFDTKVDIDGLTFILGLVFHI